MLQVYFDEYYKLPDAKRNKMKLKYNPKKLFLKAYNYGVRFESEKSTDKEESTDLPPMPTPECDEKVKERKRLKIFTPNKLLIRLPILLGQLKAANNSYKLKSEIRQILYLLYQHNKITKKSFQQLNEVIIIMKESVIVIRGPKTFYFDFDWPKILMRILSMKLNLS